MKAPSIIVFTIILVLSVAVLIDFKLWWSFDDHTVFSTSTSSDPYVQGKFVFDKRNCVSCHKMGGQGGEVGPDLKGILERRDPEWVRKFMKDPDAILDSDDPVAAKILKEANGVRMPNPGLSIGDIDKLMAFFAGPQKPGEEELPVSDIVGNMTEGERLFTGMRPMKNKGPACMSCHSIGGVGRFGGGRVGPDLTHIASRAKEGLPGMIKGLAFTTMQPIYWDKPLTNEEQAHLITFFRSADSRKESPFPVLFIMSGFGGFILMLLLSHCIWIRRARGVRKFVVGDTK